MINIRVPVSPPIIENKESIKITLLRRLQNSSKNGITLDGITYYSDVLRTWINCEDEQGNKLKFKVREIPSVSKKALLYDPEIKEYFDTLQKTSCSDMTLWDLC
jgi:putative transposase